MCMGENFFFFFVNNIFCFLPKFLNKPCHLLPSYWQWQSVILYIHTSHFIISLEIKFHLLSPAHIFSSLLPSYSIWLIQLKEKKNSRLMLVHWKLKAIKLPKQLKFVSLPLKDLYQRQSRYYFYLTRTISLVIED